MNQSDSARPLRVSVVIPAYNEEHDIVACLEALMAQSEQPYEIIVVDNNSTDRTAEIAHQYGARVVTESRQGIVYARTAGFNAALENKGCDVIARTDADTVVGRHWVRAIRTACTDPATSAVTGYAQIEELSGVPLLRMKWLLPTLSRLHALTLKGHVLYGFNMAIRREIWERIKDVALEAHSAPNEDVQMTLLVRQYCDVRIVPAMHVCSKVRDVVRIRKFSRYLLDDMKTSLRVRTSEKKPHGRTDV